MMTGRVAPRAHSTAETLNLGRITGRGATFLAKPVSGNDLINAIHAGMKRVRTAA